MIEYSIIIKVWISYTQRFIFTYCYTKARDIRQEKIYLSLVTAFRDQIIEVPIIINYYYELEFTF